MIRFQKRVTISPMRGRPEDTLYCIKRPVEVGYDEQEEVGGEKNVIRLVINHSFNSKWIAFSHVGYIFLFAINVR